LEDCLKLLNSLSDCKDLIPYAIRWVDYQIDQRRKQMQQQSKTEQQTNATEPERKNEAGISEQEQGNSETRNNGFPPYQEDEEKIFHP